MSTHRFIYLLVWVKIRCRAIQLFGWVVKAHKHASDALIIIYGNELAYLKENYYVAKWLINHEPAHGCRMVFAKLFYNINHPTHPVVRLSTSSSCWWMAAPGIASITALTITGMSFFVRGASTEASISPSEEPSTLRLLELEVRVELTLCIVFLEEFGVDFPLPQLLLNWLLDLDFPLDACLVRTRTFVYIINTIAKLSWISTYSTSLWHLLLCDNAYDLCHSE